ncbi:MAG: sigma-54 dependent transcriptional regulator [Candidatus Poribacteria bacterium]|nr:sigma-54 dependent transcriptional regulator [Candidatus Poribacteria bacterium]
MRHSILIADDDDSIRFVLEKALQKEGHHTFSARNGKETIALLRSEPVDVIFLDIFLGDANGLELIETLQEINRTASIIVITGHGTTQTAIEAAKRHAYDYVTKPFDIKEIQSLVARAGSAANQAKAVMTASESQPAHTSVAPTDGREMKSQIAGESPVMQMVYRIIGRAAISDETVLVMGESGTGKELVARAIHQNSRRADKALVVVDCSAVPANLIESALFGHVKGAYTGADTARQGKFEQAGGGTIFLDEVGELPPEVQMKMLRVLQEREIEPVGSNKSRKVDVRVVAATNRRLDLAIQDGDFREDLFYRLNVVPIYLPPLRERKEDIPDLVDLFITRFAEDYGLPKVAISSQAFKRLMGCNWPGNVRELENTLKHALVMCSGNVLLPEHFPELAGGTTSSMTTPATSLESRLYALLREWVDESIESGIVAGSLQAEIRTAVEKPLFVLVLERTGWNRSKAAEILGINRNTLHSKMEEYGIQN